MPEVNAQVQCQVLAYCDYNQSPRIPKQEVALGASSSSLGLQLKTEKPEEAMGFAQVTWPVIQGDAGT